MEIPATLHVMHHCIRHLRRADALQIGSGDVTIPFSSNLMVYNIARVTEYEVTPQGHRIVVHDGTDDHIVRQESTDGVVSKKFLKHTKIRVGTIVKVWYRIQETPRPGAIAGVFFPAEALEVLEHPPILSPGAAQMHKGLLRQTEICQKYFFQHYDDCSAFYYKHCLTDSQRKLKSPYVDPYYIIPITYYQLKENLVAQFDEVFERIELFLHPPSSDIKLPNFFPPLREEINVTGHLFFAITQCIEFEQCTRNPICNKNGCNVLGFEDMAYITPYDLSNTSYNSLRLRRMRSHFECGLNEPLCSLAVDGVEETILTTLPQSKKARSEGLGVHHIIATYPKPPKQIKQASKRGGGHNGEDYYMQLSPAIYFFDKAVTEDNLHLDIPKQYSILKRYGCMPAGEGDMYPAVVTVQKPTEVMSSDNNGKTQNATNDNNSKAQIISTQKTGWSAIVANKPPTAAATTNQQNTTTQPESSFATAETAIVKSTTTAIPNPTTIAAYTHQASVLQQYLEIKDNQFAMQAENHSVKIASSDEQYTNLAQHYQEEVQKKDQQIEMINQQYQAQLQAKDAQIQQLLIALMARNKEREQSY